MEEILGKRLKTENCKSLKLVPIMSPTKKNRLQKGRGVTCNKKIKPKPS